MRSSGHRRARRFVCTTIATALLTVSALPARASEPAPARGESSTRRGGVAINAFSSHVHRLASDTYATAGLYEPAVEAQAQALRAALRDPRLAALVPEAVADDDDVPERSEAGALSWRLPDSISLQEEPEEIRKNFWLAAGEVMLVQAIPWSVNAYVRDEDWAKNIGVHSWLENLVRGWEWDDNQFVNNQFSHPYHGNLYFNAGRSNGYNYWESMGWAFAGSWMWEYFGETFQPAINDWLMTSLGGTVLGEMTYRLSSTILDNEAKGWDRTGRETAAFLVNPVRGFTRLVTGQASGQRPNPDGRFPGRIRSVIDIGGRAVREEDVDGSKRSNGFFFFELDYGDGFRGDNRKPFDNFRLTVQVDFGEQGGLGQLNVDGMLVSKPLDWSSSNQHQFNIYQHYMYYNTAGFELGGQMFGAGLASLFPTGERSELRTKAEGTVIVLGAVNSEFAAVVGRSYDYGPGASIDLETEWWRDQFPLVRLRYRGFFIHTLNGAEGEHFVQALQLRLALPLFSRLGVGADFTAVRRDSTFTSFPDIVRKDTATKLYLTWATAS